MTEKQSVSPEVLELQKLVEIEELKLKLRCLREKNINDCFDA